MPPDGWRAGLTGGYRRFALDADLLRMVQEFLQPVEVDDAAMALEAMLEVGPGGHFFGAKHTLERYATAFYQPMISDWRNFNQWQAAGSPQAAQKANALWKQALAEYREPYLDPAVAEEIDAFVARRVAEGGEITDF